MANPHTDANTDTLEHTSSRLWGEESSSYCIIQPSKFSKFHTPSPFFPVALKHSYKFFLSPIQTLSLSPTLLGFLSAGLLLDRKGFVRCQIPELRDQRQTKRRVTYCSILERQKMESLIDQDIAFFPFSPLAPLSLIQSSFLALVFFPPFVSLSPTPSQFPLSLN